MSEPEPINFRPRWHRNADPQELSGLEAEPWIGSQPLVFPRITTRILPTRGEATLSAVALGEILEGTQKLTRFAAYDVVRGFNPEFADLRSIGADLLHFSTLTVEPFEEGSFVVPARLGAAAMERAENNKPTVTTDDVARRFYEIFERLNHPEGATDVSIGALQTVDSLNKVLCKAAAEIEFTVANSHSESRDPFRSEPAFWDGIKRSLIHRRPSSEKLEELVGRVTLLDILQGKLLLSVAELADRIPGSFPTTLHPKLLESLGREVRLFGLIERRRGKPVRINIQDSDILDDD